jgi:hypothetical protein
MKVTTHLRTVILAGALFSKNAFANLSYLSNRLLSCGGVQILKYVVPS